MIKKVLPLFLASLLSLNACQPLDITPPDESLLSPKEITLINHVKEAVKKAEQKESKLSAEALSIAGFSGKKIKHLLNNLCSLPQATYLEIGCFKGSTFCAAAFGNETFLKEAIGIDNWSEFQGPKGEFFHNIQTIIPDAPVKILEKNCFRINPLKEFDSPINIYLYDGSHDFFSQVKAFLHFDKAFDDVFIAMVDDWGWKEPQEGTMTALRDLDYTILYQKNLYTPDEEDPTEEYWNGFVVMVLRSNKHPK